MHVDGQRLWKTLNRVKVGFTADFRGKLVLCRGPVLLQEILRW